MDSCCQVSVQEGLGTFNVGLTTDSPSRFGLYNTGLTLTEGEQEKLTGITFKILSAKCFKKMLDSAGWTAKDLSVETRFKLPSKCGYLVRMCWAFKP